MGSRAAERSVRHGECFYAGASLFHSAAPLFGALIGLITLVLPIASVLSSRSPAAEPVRGATAQSSR